MKTSFFNVHDVVYYMGKLYRIMGWGISGPYAGKMMLKLCGFEAYGQWGPMHFSRQPVPNVAWVNPKNPFLYHA